MLNKTEESDFSPPSRDWARKFQGILEQNGLNVTMRRSMGEDISAACGQLRRKAIAANERNGLTT
jgi:23S rRNA (adenine2503-C2)-methyltransferase